MKFLIFITSVLLSITFASAEDLTTLSGNTYKNARVTRATSESVTVKHSAGIATVSAVDLPDDLKLKFIPPPTTNAAVQSGPVLYHVRGTVLLVIREGIVLDAGIMTARNYRRLVYLEKTDPTSKQWFNGKMYQVGGDKPRPKEHSEQCLILGEGAGIADNDPWSGEVYYAGIHRGRVSTVRCFSKSKEAAEARLKQQPAPAR